MKLLYGKTPDGQETLAIRNLAGELGVTFDTARLLYFRGADTKEKARRFLSPDKTAFGDPLLLSGMKEAVARITRARDDGDSVLVFGDYDADGICATAILTKALAEFGINAEKIVPEREDGYGLNVSLVDEVRKNRPINLLITVDCGISDAEKIEELKKRGIDVIVTDHHEPPEILPDCVRIDPKIAGQEYPFNGLCGAGVAYKLSRALIGEKADDYLDLAALATVADSMDLIEENRSIVAEGLKLINAPRPRAVFKNLLGDNKKATAQTLAFQVAPRLNAGGRMGDAKAALEAFTSDDENVVFDRCVKLSAYNVQRQVECDEMYKEAKELIHRENSFFDPVILVASEKWRTGFIGIVAARLSEDFSRPVIVFAGVDGGYKGSARSVPEVNIFEALCAVKDLTVEFGGHSQAAGVAVTKENYELLRAGICAYVKERKLLAKAEKTVFAEWNIQGKIDARFAKELDMLEPFGVGNRRPLFTAEEESGVISRPLKKGSPHYTFNLEAGEMLDFGGGGNVEVLALPVKKTVVFEINRSIFGGKEYVKGFVKNVLTDKSDLSAIDPFVLRNELKKLLGTGENGKNGAIAATAAGGFGASASDTAAILDDSSTACDTATEAFDTAATSDTASATFCFAAATLDNADDFEARPIEKGLGTLYAVSDYKNLKYYGYGENGEDESGKRPEIYFFRPPERSAADCVVVSLSEACGEHGEIVYLDKPVAVKDFGLPVSANKTLDGYSRLLSGASADRGEFARVFSYLLSLNGKPFIGTAEAFVEYKPSFSAAQFIFSAETFLELGIFAIENGRLLFDARVKSALDNSTIYKAVKTAVKL